MKNMSPAITRPVHLKTRVVHTSPIKSIPQASNKSPCQCESMKGDRITGIPDHVQRPHRTIYSNGF